MEIIKKLSLNLLILVTLFHSIRGVFFSIKQQEKIGSKPQLTQNLVESLSETVITPALLISDEKVDDNEVRDPVVQNLSLYESFGEDNSYYKTDDLRKKRAENKVMLDKELDCLSCFANGSSPEDNNCYNAILVPITKCAKKEKCYSEMHPDYLRRGCKLKSLLNRTHICKCPLCNDKPFDDTSYYDYKNLGDWEYDNRRLDVPLVGIDLLCKLCETNGTNPKLDRICKIGKNANFTMCEHNQMCYMNVDGKNVSRGCIDRPKYNSIYFFCRSSLCNNKTFLNPNSRQKLWLYKKSSRAIFLIPSCIIYYVALCIMTILFEAGF